MKKLLILATLALMASVIAAAAITVAAGAWYSRKRRAT